MRIVIAGAGEVGYNLARELSHNYEVIVIENDERKADEVDKLNVEVIRGNAASPSVLSKADVGNADIFIGVTGNDEANLIAGIAARKLGVKKTIVRVGNPEYVDKPIVKDHFMGYDVVICPQLALASAIANLVTIPGAVDFVSFSGGKVDMVEIIIPKGSPVAGKKVAELPLPENVILTAVYRNGELIVPRGDTELREGDKVAVVGTWESIGKMTRVFGDPVVKNVVIFGGGIVGSYVARILDKSNLNIKIIDSNPEVCESLCRVLKRTRVIIGDATDLDLLMEEEVGKSDVAIATTESDGKNLLVSLLAKSLGAKKAIARVEKVGYAKLFEKVGVDAALSPRKITYAEVIKNLRLMDVHTLAELGGEAAVLEVSVKSEKLSGRRIRDIKLPKRAIIGAILRGDECLIPKGETELRLGDKLLVFTTWEDIEEVEDRLS
ncbi:Trk system potassium transporter TrkA [Archaeoglobus veneficus]|uniref:TrkA-N domain protein n=1 Tax=Archaeoglobus veneficus (strain DSM 11195 / SNP6) TaxID=693661 RepID=F2KRK6_ARCVS|nr:Trk system potassium transporter TrkA [Archaeoglobus veneficus]AEA46771.1 TrkA-N domain protein [Archaeoglobus veneficus SNP6]